MWGRLGRQTASYNQLGARLRGIAAVATHVPPCCMWRPMLYVDPGYSPAIALTHPDHAVNREQLTPTCSSKYSALALADPRPPRKLLDACADAGVAPTLLCRGQNCIQPPCQLSFELHRPQSIPPR